MTIKDVPLEQLHPSPLNPRKSFRAIDDLAESMKQEGVLQALLVRPNKDGFEIVFGERRFRAAKKAGLKTVPASVKEMTDVEAFTAMLIENTQRADMHPLEECDAFHEMTTKHGKTVAQAAADLGLPPAHLYTRLRLYPLCPSARKHYLAGDMTGQVAELLARIPNVELQERATKEVMKQAETYNNDLGGYVKQPMAAGAARRHLIEHYTLRLADAPFNTKDAKLVETAGACDACPKRTANQKELFADIGKDDLCLDPECFEQKRAVAFELVKAKAEGDGKAVAPAALEKKLYTYGNHLSPSSGYVELSDKCHADPKGKTYKALLAKDMPQVMIARDAHGKIHEVVALKDVAKKFKDAGYKFGDRVTEQAKASTRYQASPAEKDRVAKERAKAKLKRETYKAAIAGIVEKASKAEFDRAHWMLLLLGFTEGSWNDYLKEVIDRRGIETNARNAPGDTLLKYGAGLAVADLQALVVEIVVTRGAYNAWGAPKALHTACALFKIDVKKLEKEQRARLTAKPPKPVVISKGAKK